MLPAQNPRTPCLTRIYAPKEDDRHASPPSKAVPVQGKGDHEVVEGMFQKILTFSALKMRSHLCGSLSLITLSNKTYQLK